MPKNDDELIQPVLRYLKRRIVDAETRGITRGRTQVLDRMRLYCEYLRDQAATDSTGRYTQIAGEIENIIANESVDW
jgi:hypothetical protein